MYKIKVKFLIQKIKTLILYKLLVHSKMDGPPLVFFLFQTFKNTLQGVWINVKLTLSVYMTKSYRVRTMSMSCIWNQLIEYYTSTRLTSGLFQLNKLNLKFQKSLAKILQCKNAYNSFLQSDLFPNPIYSVSLMHQTTKIFL